jgi:hypothetical protein
MIDSIGERVAVEKVIFSAPPARVGGSSQRRRSHQRRK